MKFGTLYGIGTGPGDPELLTIKSVNILKKVDAVFAASSSKNDYSLAVEVCRAHIPRTTRIIMLPFPMTRDEKVARQAWRDNARTIIDWCQQGKNAAFLTIGDPLTYSTYGYLLKNVQSMAPDLPVVTVPGITSFQAAASRLNTPLAQGEESLFITSGAGGGENLSRLGILPENVVFLKAYRNIDGICDALEKAGMLHTSVAVMNCGRTDEMLIKDIRLLKERPSNYWTLIIAKHANGNPPKDKVLDGYAESS